MIVFDLACTDGHRFEGWFASSPEFERQHTRGLVTCPQCGSEQVAKAPMAPAVPRKGNQLASVKADQAMAGAALPPEAQALLEKLAQVQAETLKGSRFVGKAFADQSRAIHYGEQDAEVIHGEATLAEAKDLLDEGIPVLPLPFPVAPPEEFN